MYKRYQLVPLPPYKNLSQQFFKIIYLIEIYVTTLIFSVLIFVCFLNYNHDIIHLLPLCYQIGICM